MENKKYSENWETIIFFFYLFSSTSFLLKVMPQNGILYPVGK